MSSKKSKLLPIDPIFQLVATGTIPDNYLPKSIISYGGGKGMFNLYGLIP
jgi:hypothetical protein